jgi:hypothetical protein
MPDHHELMSKQPLSSWNTERGHEAAGTGKHAAALGCAGILAVTVLAGGCGEDPMPQDPDATPMEFAVRGAATGVLRPVALELRQGSEVEPLTVTQDGAFAFEARLRTGATYSVDLADPDTPCTLRNQAGVIADADPNVELTCTGGLLASVVVSGIAPTIALAPGTTEYVVELPVSQPSVTVTATVATAGDTLTIAGTAVDSGAPSAEIPLSPGDNALDIVVDNDQGWQRTYHLTLRRAAKLTQYAYGKASRAGSRYFGYSMALSGDTLAVGVIGDDSGSRGVDGNQDDSSALYSGAVHVFRRTGATWQQEAYVKASNTGDDDYFGCEVALSGDVLAVAACNEDSAARGIDGNQNDESAQGSGAVYVFRRTGATWQQEAYVKSSNSDSADRFGAGLALSGDTLVVGAPYEDSQATGVNGDEDDDSVMDSGAVYVFRHTGTAWQQEAYLKASNTGFIDNFGVSVAVSGDTIAVGAWFEGSAARGVDGDQANGDAPYSGAVYVFRRTETSWQQEAYVKASNTGSEDYFGQAVALAGDTLAVGAFGEDSASQGVGGNEDDNAATDSGAVYVFRRTGADWQQEAYVKASNTTAGDELGRDIALSGDTLAVGAQREDSAAQGVDGNDDDNAAQDSGAVYVFRRTDMAWQQAAYLKGSNTGAHDFFGYSVALSDDTLASGASEEDSEATGVGGDQGDTHGGTQSGAVYIFH